MTVPKHNERRRDTPRQRDNGRPSRPAPIPVEDRTPPQDILAEQCVLGGMLLSKEAAEEVVPILKASDFYRPAHTTIYRTINELRDRGEPADAITVAAHLPAAELERIGGAPYIHTLISTVPTAANATYYARIVAEKAVLRGLVEAGTKVAQLGYRVGEVESLDALLDLAQKAVAVVVDRRAASRPGNGLAQLMFSGGSFILDVPDVIPAIWGEGDDVLWAEGESLIIAGPSGVGKTTITAQLLRARLGLSDRVLGMPVWPGMRVLYLAMDRPMQIQRALNRNFVGKERAILDERLVFWKGPPPRDVAKYPEILLEMAQAADADTVIVDSVKDAAIGLSDDEVGASYNRARQAVLADGRQLLELHHVTKRGANGGPPNTLADVYGSAHLVNGAGSVVMLWGNAGDPIVDFRHLKQPMSEVGPFKILHEGRTGQSSIWDGADLLELLRRCRSTGVSASDAACVMYSSERPSASEVEKARRRLEQMALQGLAVQTGGGKGRGNAAKWFLAAPDSWTDGIDGGER